MPLGPGVRYRYTQGGKVRLAFRGDQVIEAKNPKTGATHTPAEFSADRAARRSGPGKCAVCQGGHKEHKGSM